MSNKRNQMYVIGHINPDTDAIASAMGYALLLSDACQGFESIMYRLDTTTPERPLREAWPIVNRTGGVDGTPYSLVTVAGLFELMTADIPALSELPYAKEEDGTLRASGVVSRKKQLLPVVLGALEG